MYAGLWQRGVRIHSSDDTGVGVVDVPNMFPVESGCLVALTRSNIRDVSLLSRLTRCLAVCLPQGNFVEEGEPVGPATNLPSDATSVFIRWFKHSKLSPHCFRYRIKVLSTADHMFLTSMMPSPPELSVAMGAELQDPTLASEVLKGLFELHRSRLYLQALCYHLGTRNVMPSPVPEVSVLGLCQGAMKGGNLALLQFLMELSNHPGIVSQRASLFNQMFDVANFTNNRLWATTDMPQMNAYLLELHGRHIHGVGVLNISPEVRQRLLQFCAVGLSREGTAVTFGGQRRDALYFNKLRVEMFPGVFHAWVALGCRMKGEKTVTLQLAGSGRVSTWSRSACASKALELKPDSAVGWNNFAWYSHCEGLKEVSFAGKVMSTAECAITALCIDSRKASAWDTLGVILGPEGSISTNQVPLTQYTPLAERTKLIEEFPSSGSLCALDCFERHLYLTISKSQSPYCAFLHCGLVLAHKNKTLGAPPANLESYIQPSDGILNDRFARQLSSLDLTEVLGAKIAQLMERVNLPGCKLCEEDCYVLALAFDEERTLTTLLTSEHHLECQRLLNCIDEFLSPKGRRVVRKYR